MSYKTGFVVHDVHMDFPNTKRRMLRKAHGWQLALIHMLPARTVHNVLMPLIPVAKLRMGSAQNIEGAYGSTDTIFWGVPFDPKQIKARELQAIDKIVQAGLYCAEEGAALIGLGAYTSIIGNGGVDVTTRLNKHGIHVTTGNSFTAGSAVQGIIELASRVGYDVSRCTAAVIGAGGSTGSVAAQLLAERVSRILLVGRDGTNLTDLVRKIGHKAHQVDMQQAIRDADLIIAVTSATTSLAIDPQLFKPGALICDVARPRDIGPLIAQARPDVLVFEGSIIKIPGQEAVIDWEFGFPPLTTYACMAETMILGLEGYQGNFSVGKTLDLDQVKQILVWAEKHGFTLAGYRSFDKPIDDSRINNFRQYVTM